MGGDNKRLTLGYGGTSTPPNKNTVYEGLKGLEPPKATAGTTSRFATAMGSMFVAALVAAVLN